MTPPNREGDVLGYGDQAAKKPAAGSGDYGRRAVEVPDAALARAASAATGKAVVLAPSGAQASEIAVGHQEVSVGERISLSVPPLPLAAAMALTVVSVRWDIPGVVVKSYQQRLEFAKAVPLSKEDRSKTTVAFHWVDGDNVRKRKVTAECVVVSAIVPTRFTLVFSWTFEVKAPELRYLRDRRPKNKQGRTRIGSNRIDPDVRGHALEFTADKIKVIGHSVERNAGMAWDWSIFVPGGHEGQVKDLQTVFGFRERRKFIQMGSKKTYRSLFKIRIKDNPPTFRPLLAIPGSDPPLGFFAHDGIQSGEPRYSDEYPRPIMTGKPDGDSGSGADWPNSWFDPQTDAYLFVYEKFNYYLFYRPDKPGAIWVPVAKAEWFWKGKVVSNRREWRLLEAKGGITKEGAPTAELPEWDAHAMFLDWDVSGQPE